MGCDCEKILEKEYPRHGDLEKHLEYLVQEYYRDGKLCGEFESKYWYKCKECGSLYVYKVMDGDPFDFKKYKGEMSAEEIFERFKDEES